MRKNKKKKKKKKKKREEEEEEEEEERRRRGKKKKRDGERRKMVLFMVLFDLTHSPEVFNDMDPKDFFSHVNGSTILVPGFCDSVTIVNTKKTKNQPALIGYWFCNSLMSPMTHQKSWLESLSMIAGMALQPRIINRLFKFCVEIYWLETTGCWNSKIPA